MLCQPSVSMRLYGLFSLVFRTPLLGKQFEYYTCGAAVSEVEIDCLTGDHTVSGMIGQIVANWELDIFRVIEPF